MSVFNTAGGSTYTLQSSISSTQTTITLASFKVPVSGANMTMALMNTDIAYATIAPRTSQSEFISFTGITQNADGTATLTGITRGLNKTYPGTENTSFKLPHAGSTQFILSDAPQVFNKYSVISNDETITGQKIFPQSGQASSALVGAVYAAPVQDTEIATKKYVDGIAISGSPKATDSVYGIAKLSVVAVSPTAPVVVGQNDPKVPPIDTSTMTANQVAALAGTGTPNGTTGKYVTNDDTSSSAASGKVVRASGTALPALDGSALTKIATKLTRLAGYSPASNTSENTVFTTTITGGLLGTAGMIRFRTPVYFQTNATAEIWTVRIKYGGTTLFTNAISTGAIGGGSGAVSYGMIEGWIINNAATNSQNVGSYITLAPQSVGSNVLCPSAGHSTDTTSAIDTTANQTLAMTVQRTNGGGGAGFFYQTVVEAIYG